MTWVFLESWNVNRASAREEFDVQGLTCAET